MLKSLLWFLFLFTFAMTLGMGVLAVLALGEYDAPSLFGVASLAFTTAFVGGLIGVLGLLERLLPAEEKSAKENPVAPRRTNSSITSPHHPDYKP